MCGSRRARLRDYTACSHERFMMLARVCVCVCDAQALTGKREQGEMEKKERRVGGVRVQSVRQIDGAQPCSLQPAIILLASFHTFSDAILFRLLYRSDR